MPPTMYRTAARSLFHHSLPALRSSTRQRLLSTAPREQKSRSWKSSAVRWGLAAAGVYYYNTSNVFAEEPAYLIAQPPVPEEPPLQTLESFSSTRRPSSRLPPSTSPTLPPSASSTLPPSTSSLPPPPPTPTTLDASPTSTPSEPPRTPEEYEEEAGQQGAFNEETGEINWDCPCLGGMAHGPCGEEFRAAFSCFVYSKEEPKGMDCIEKFKGMQDCFRQHPDVYGAELEDSDNSPDEDLDQPQSEAPENPETTPALPSTSQPNSVSNPTPTDDPTAQTARAKAATAQVSRDHGAQSESDELVPKAAHDAGPSRGEK